MPTIARITGAVISGQGIAAAAPPAPEQPRVVRVPDSALPLLRRAGITPPQFGQLTAGYVDRQCAEANLSISERMIVKGTLRNCGLLTAGKPV